MGSFQLLDLGIGRHIAFEIVQVVASKDLALHHFDPTPRLAPISAYRRPFPPILKVASLSTVGAQNW